MVFTRSSQEDKIIGARSALSFKSRSYSILHVIVIIICLLGEEPVKITKEVSRDKFQMRSKKRASKKRELTQIIKHSLKAI